MCCVAASCVLVGCVVLCCVVPCCVFVCSFVYSDAFCQVVFGMLCCVVLRRFVCLVDC